MPFGLRNAAQTQQRLMTEVLHGLDYCFVYLDDILVASKTVVEHRAHLEEVFGRQNRYHLVVNIKKSQFGAETLDFLGHTVNSRGIIPLPSKVQAILDFPTPLEAWPLRGYLGMLNFYRRFIPNSASHQIKLQSLITTNKKKDRTRITWTPEALESFQTTKDSLARAALLAQPDPMARLSLITDASDLSIGQTLSNGDTPPPTILGFFFCEN